MAIFKYLLEKLLLPLILSTPVITAIVSKLQTDSWLEYIKNVSTEQWMIIGGVVLSLLAARWMFMRVSAVKELNKGYLPFAFISNPLYGWEDMGELTYKGVIWKIRLAVHSMVPENMRLTDIEVDTPPRCPKCKTEIEQKHTLLGRYLWSCVNCSFKRRNGESYYKEAERANKIARRFAEEEFAKRKGQ